MDDQGVLRLDAAPVRGQGPGTDEGSRGPFAGSFAAGLVAALLLDLRGNPISAGRQVVAAMLSAALVTEDIETIIEVGLSEIPARCRPSAQHLEPRSWLGRPCASGSRAPWLLLAGLLACILACAPGGRPDRPETAAPAAERTAVGGPRYGGHLRVAHSLEPTSLDAVLGRSGADAYFWRQMFDQLVDADPKLAPRPETSLATSWEIGTDPDSITFQLREGVVFHDGAPFNAEAVKYNIERILDPDTIATPRASLAVIESVEVIDEYTVRFDLARPWGAGFGMLADRGGVMSSPTAIEALGPSAEVVRAMLKKIGIRMDIDVLSSGPATERFNHGQEYPLFITSWSRYPEPDWMASLAYKSDGYYNPGNVLRPDVDELVELGASFYDNEARKQVYVEINRTVLGEAWFTPLLYGVTYAAAPRRVRNLDQLMGWDGKMNFVNIWLED